MATYDDLLFQEQLLELHGAIKSFLDSYGTHRGNPNQRTLIFFPGGMGSELARATRVFDPNLPRGSYGNYETIWVDLEKILLEEWAYLLQMNANRDTGDRFMVANGPLKNCALHPYDNLPAWCAANSLDLLMVGWDFRRPAKWNVKFFFDYLVPEVRRLAALRNWPEDIFQGATVIGHSFGGMLAKWILNKPGDQFCRNLRLVITVATTFYGAASESTTLFTSKRELGPFYDLDRITFTIATLHGIYSLFMLDYDTYTKYQQLLSQDREFPLLSYPSVDVVRGTPVDPYVLQQNPDNPNQWRYPIKNPNHNFDWPWFSGYLQTGLADFQAVAKPLDASLRDRVHHIRGVQTQGGVDAKETKVAQKWGWYDVTKPRKPQASGVLSMSLGEGDGVVPAWSARLATQSVDNVHTIRGDLDGEMGRPAFQHMTMMDDPKVRSCLLDLIRPGQPQHVVELRTPPPAPTEEYENVRQEVERIAFSREKVPAQLAIRTYLRGFTPVQQQALALRWMIEFSKGNPVTR